MTSHNYTVRTICYFQKHILPHVYYSGPQAISTTFFYYIHYYLILPILLHITTQLLLLVTTRNKVLLPVTSICQWLLLNTYYYKYYYLLLPYYLSSLQSCYYLLLWETFITTCSHYFDYCSILQLLLPITTDIASHYFWDITTCYYN